MIAAVAAIVAAGTAPKQRKAAVEGSPSGKAALNVSQVFDALEAGCSEVIQLRPYARASILRFGAVLAGIQGLEVADLDRVVSWIQAGGLRWWTDKQIPITWESVVKAFPTWVARARAWEASSLPPSTTGPESWR